VSAVGAVGNSTNQNFGVSFVSWPFSAESTGSSGCNWIEPAPAAVVLRAATASAASARSTKPRVVNRFIRSSLPSWLYGRAVPQPTTTQRRRRLARFIDIDKDIGRAYPDGASMGA
jgi:hypothetical protein